MAWLEGTLLLLKITHSTLLVLWGWALRLVSPVALKISRRVSIMSSRASSSLEIVALPLTACICAWLRCRELKRAAATDSRAASSIDADGHALASSMGGATPQALTSARLALAIFVVCRRAICLLGVRWGSGSRGSWDGELEPRRGPFLLGEFSCLLGFGKS